MSHPDLITTSIWDEPGNVETLTRMWADGASASTIALYIGQGVSRSAVLGKIDRLRLPKRANVPTARPLCPIVNPNERRSQYASIRRHSEAVTFPVKPARHDGSDWCPLPGTSPVQLVDLEPGMCKWPIGEGKPYLFCGAPADGPYCPCHASMSAGRGTESERAAHRARLA